LASGRNWIVLRAYRANRAPDVEQGVLLTWSAFFGEHRDCPGGIAGAVEERADGSAVVWLACETCEVRIVRAT